MIDNDSLFIVLCPKAIYLGSKMDAATREELLAIARLKNIPAYEMHTVIGKFDLNPVPSKPSHITPGG